MTDCLECGEPTEHVSQRCDACRAFDEQATRELAEELAERSGVGDW